ncbi:MULTISPECIES: pyrimidine-nucleoside phosphorylase [Bacillus]|uniref:Pyrimidine-nucleoside phosphorylase n=2 Tax=Bacillus TaxID=1386 RepID=A0A0M3R9I2_9BACI|nr:MULTISPECIES: pyrimidine-nucleoside phosphorylase [Bacillus]ALC81482.1 thymidine phosphorylase [Bacillus gobiensis]MBP1080525.1 pyrimidine-nucleoside phosphorylase [Bacillus capparidis]MED1094382.1 pyrimidine-nucleoside phosphorylase [Bacillus capparidis]
MRMVDIIQDKRNGKELSDEQIDFFIQGYTNGEIPDYQASALLMAIYFKGMSPKETALFTQSMVDSGEKLDLSQIKGVKIDKHSTGGVGDKISLIVTPMVSSLGVPIAKMSGRGLGHTGGTLDKLESISGFNIELSKEQFIELVNDYGLALIGQTGNLAPADKKLYALRDVTGTVNSLPLIASSIMSKKIAMGADGIVLDVKTGSGAFMKNLEDATDLAKEMVSIGNSLNKNTVAVITDMNQPLGHEVGNANEVKEVIQVLKGEKIDDLLTISLAIATQMCLANGVFTDENEAKNALIKSIEDGSALNKFKQFISNQGGDPSVVDDPNRLPQPRHRYDLKLDKKGFIHGIEAEAVGQAALYLGAGRAKKDDNIDHSAGITLHKKIGDAVREGEAVATLFSLNEITSSAIEKLTEAYTIKSSAPEKIEYVKTIIK